MLINTPGVAVPTSHRWPLGDEGKQAKKHRGGQVHPLTPKEELVGSSPDLVKFSPI